MAKMVWVVSYNHESGIIGVFDNYNKMINAVIEDLVNSDYFYIVREQYCDEEGIDYYALDEDDEDFDVFDNKVVNWVKENLKSDESSLDEWYYIESYYLNNEA